MAFCPYCGSEVEQGAKFCDGAALEQQTPPQPTARASPAEPQPQRADGFPPPPEARIAPQRRQRKSAQSAPRSSSRIVAGVLVLLAVLWGLIGRRLFAPYEMQTEPVDPSRILHRTEFWNGDCGTAGGSSGAALATTRAQRGGWWDACPHRPRRGRQRNAHPLGRFLRGRGTSPRQACRRRPISRRADGSSRQGSSFLNCR